nr:hypothetical protein [Tanacetum cinerariifolium]
MMNRNDVRHRFMLCCSGYWKDGRVRASLASVTSTSVATDKVKCVVVCTFTYAYVLAWQSHESVIAAMAGGW